MHSTVCLLTAAWLAAQPGPTTPLGPQTSDSTYMQKGATTPPSDSSQGSSPRLIDRFRNMFRSNQPDTKTKPAPTSSTQPAPTTIWSTRTPGQPATNPGQNLQQVPAPGLLKVQPPPVTVTTAPPRMAGTTTAAPSTVPVTTSAAPPLVNEPPMSGNPMNTKNGIKSPIELSAKDLERVGHEQDYSWITGRLFRIPGESGRWGIRYAGADEVDRYGGSLALSQTPDMSRYHHGDLVCVHGKVAGAARGVRPTSNVYEVKDINVIEAGR